MSTETTGRERLGTVEKKDGKHVLRFERRLKHPIERVWAAITEPEQLAGWIGDAELDLTKGGKVTLRFKHRVSKADDENYDVIRPEEFEQAEDEYDGFEAVVTAVDPPRLLEYEAERFGLLRWELQADRAGCLLTFSQVLALPDDAMAAQVLAGWHSFLDLLEDALAGDPMTDWSRWSMDYWARLRDSYASRLG
jgi:uncharacterized protein YndB with AHSA1/START domain